MDIIEGDFEGARHKEITSWLRYPYSATENKVSFYQIILKELGIPYSKSESSSSLTLHQLLRLMYVDQMTSLDRLFKFDKFDNSNKRKAIGELLIGLSDISLYQHRVRLQRLDSELSNKVEEIKTLSMMNVPTLIVWGREEKGIPLQTGQEMHKILKDSRFEIIDEAGHCAHDDQSDRFNQLALNFLAPSINAR